MSDFQPTPEQLHQAALMLGDPVAMALQAIRDYAQDLSRAAGSITAEELIKTGETWVYSEQPWGGQYLNKGSHYEGVLLRKSFWDHLEKYLEQAIPESRRKNFLLGQEPERRSGRSTRLVIEAVGYLLDNPGKRLKITDHHPTQQAAELVFREVRDVLNLLRVDHTASNDLTIVVHPLPAHRIRS